MIGDERRRAFGVPVEIDGERYDLFFDYAAQKRLINDYGKNIDALIIQVGESEDPDLMAGLLSAGIGSVLSPEEIFEISPPMLVTWKLIDKAGNVFYYGSVEVPEVDPTWTSIRKSLVKVLVEVRKKILRF